MVLTSELLPKLSGLKKTGPLQYKAICPAHNDRIQSLSIKDDNGKAIFHCHAGCEYNEIVAALGYEISSQKSSKLERYVYVDKDNVIRYRKIRTSKKNFFLEHYEKDEWKKGMGDTKPVIYNLPSVLNARDTNKLIFIVEGEKDADTLMSYGYIATTNYEGANKWRDEYSKDFKEANVIVVPDHDFAGMKHALAVAESVIKYANLVKIVDLINIWPTMPNKADITDYISCQSDKDVALKTFDQLVNSTAEFISTNNYQKKQYDMTSTISNEDDRVRIKHIVDGILPQGISLLASQPKGCKSWLALYLAYSVAFGKPFIDFETFQTDVLYIVDCDSEKARTENRLNMMRGINDKSGAHIQILVYKTSVDSITTYLEKHLAQYPNCGLVIIDPLAMIMGTKNAGDTYYHAEKLLLDPIKNIAQKYGVCILFIHHTCKSSDNKNYVEKVSGSYSITGAVDTILMLEQSDFKNVKRLLIGGRDIAEDSFLITLNDDYSWSKVNKSQSENTYDANPVVITLRTLLSNEKNYWSGTASEFIEKCYEIVGKSPVGDNATLMSKYLSKLDNYLFEIDGIEHRPPGPNGSNGKRLHYFSKVWEKRND